MSKKLASGTDAMVIDIKVGHGAHMKTQKEAEELGELMIGIGAKMNKRVIALITNMNEPLGLAVGNALEVKEAINTLKGNGPEDLTEICLELGSHMLVLGHKANDKDEAKSILRQLISSGKAFDKFSEMIKAQGGDIDMVQNTDLLPITQYAESYKSKTSGYITQLNALDIGLASVQLGAGRETKDSIIDHGAGVLLKKKRGDYVEKDEELAIIYSNNRLNFAKAIAYMDKAYEIGPEKPPKQPLILKTML
ncbi:MAG: pyrimidine-nucleoside phosphorylase, partial [Bacteroidia bacterium]|nr:pyrimidine-nucleoside phosphorylase [Bacteroidia bacterium]